MNVDKTPMKVQMIFLFFIFLGKDLKALITNERATMQINASMCALEYKYSF